MTAALRAQGIVPRSAIGRRVRIAYTNAGGEASIRVIEPLRIYQGRNGCTYVRAYCHLREEERTFRLDRIRSWEEMGRERVEAAGGQSPRPADPAPPVPASGLTATPTLTACPPRPARRRRPLRTILVLGLLFLAGRWLVSNATSARSPTPPGAAAPAPQEEPITPSEAVPKTVQRLSYRGVDIVATPQGNGCLYTAPAYALSARSRRSLHLQINARMFRGATGIADPGLEELYAGADTDRDGYLCWKEIREFQYRLTARYEYRSNATALRPDQFLAQGGGDCEDWALVTCGLLRFWGWEGYVAAFYPPGGGDGHALCLVRWTRLPRGFEYYRIEEGRWAFDGAPVPPGYYVPIDFQVVGASSNAVKRGWVLRQFYTPERIYEAAM